MMNHRSMTEITSVNGKLRFVVFDAPSDSNVAEYGAALTGLNVTVVVRSCTSTYHADKLGIKVIDLCFEDGCKAPDAIAKEFVALCVDTFGRDAFTKGASAGPAVSSVSIPAIGVHCVAGLGRAPLLVAIALIEAGMDPADAVALIRTKRRGALNAQQLNSVLEYKPVHAAGLNRSGFKLGDLFRKAVPRKITSPTPTVEADPHSHSVDMPAVKDSGIKGFFGKKPAPIVAA